MQIKLLDQDFCVCQIEDVSQVDLSHEYQFLSKTDDEISLVCPAKWVPVNTTRKEPDWRALKIAGILDFSLVGIIAKISNLLAENDISLFVISTYNTDYVLVKKTNLARTISLLDSWGYEII